jgi:uncharacterized damage-inducible protein DinB
MFHTISDFIDIWKEEAKNTEKLWQGLTDGSLNQELIPGLRTLGQLAWHLLETPKEMLGRTGLKVAGSDSNFPPTTVAAILKDHQKMVESVVHQIQTHWNNKTLHQMDNMYGEMWPRKKTLAAILFHLIHHRGQMTVFMRIAKLPVTGIYGPSKEEWQQYGLEPQI